MHSGVAHRCWRNKFVVSAVSSLTDASLTLSPSRSYQNFWWIPWLIPHIGGTVACYVYELGIALHRPDRKAPIADIKELKEYQAENQA